MLANLLVVALIATAGNVTVDAVYPNPATQGDVGEFVVLDVPEAAEVTDLTLTDGEDSVPLSGIDTTGTVVVSDQPELARRVVDAPIYTVDDGLALSNGGERVAVRANGSVLDSMTYPEAPEAELYRQGRWVRPGRSQREPTAVSDVPVATFVLPDRPGHFERTLDRADRRILLAGYTFTDDSIAQRLVEAHRRGVRVEVLLEGGPVGGVTDEQVAAVERLRSAGVPVRVMGTSRARYDYQHAKYVVADDRLVVTSENWKPGGVGGNGSRGWAVAIANETLADEAAAVFQQDVEGVDSQLWEAARPADPSAETPDNGSFPSRFEERTVTADRATVLLAPDNAASELRRVLQGANRSIAVQQVSIARDGVLLNETLDAARRGVRVRILVSGAWFVETENQKLVSHLREIAGRENLPLAARMVEPRSRFEYVHNKGVIVDDRAVVVGSVNWNPHSLSENREVAVLIEDRGAAEYYGRVFRADWRGAAWRIPWLVLAAAGLALVGGVVLARRIGRFEN